MIQAVTFDAILPVAAAIDCSTASFSACISSSEAAPGALISSAAMLSMTAQGTPARKSLERVAECIIVIALELYNTSV